MNIDDVKDVVLSINDMSYRNQEINFNFIYNNYSENETSIDDTVILNRDVSENPGVSKNKFIRINFENVIYTAANFRNTGIDINFINTALTGLFDVDVYEDKREYFNKIDNIIPHRYNLLTDIKLKEFKNYNVIKSSKESSFSISDFNNNDRSNKLSIKNDLKYIKDFKEKEFVENFNYNNLNDYEKLINNEKVVKSRVNKENFHEIYQNGNILPNLNYVSRSVNTGDIESYADFNGINCGFYIEKHILKEDSTYKFLCGRFYFNKINKVDLNNIEDEAVNYGQTYRYVVYNTYFFTTLDENNRFILNHYLLCSYPYMSNNIVCKESKAPPPPVGLSAYYNKLNKKMMLSWNNPSNYEGDVKGYQILKRESINDPFAIVKQLEGHLETDFYEPEETVFLNDIERTPGYVPNSCADYGFDENKMYIYTVRSIDAHGKFSDYGIQLGIFYDHMRNNLITNLVSNSGAHVMFPNEKVLHSSLFNKGNIEIVDNLPIVDKPKKISLYITPDFAYINNNGKKDKVLKNNYQFTFLNLSNSIYRSDIFTIDNFG